MERGGGEVVMRKVKFWFECRGFRAAEDVEVEDDATDEDVQTQLEDWMSNHFAAGWAE